MVFSSYLCGVVSHFQDCRGRIMMGSFVGREKSVYTVGQGSVL